MGNSLEKEEHWVIEDQFTNVKQIKNKALTCSTKETDSEDSSSEDPTLTKEAILIKQRMRLALRSKIEDNFKNDLTIEPGDHVVVRSIVVNE